MSTLLKIDVSPRGDYSVSRALSNFFATEWLKNNSGGTVVERDLAKTMPPFIDLPWIVGAFSAPGQQPSAEQKAALEISDELIAELFAADQIVLATPMYNFNVPAILKAWIDHVVRLGKTFSASYEGLLKDKKVTILLASGSDYRPGSPLETYNAESGYLKQIFAFIGISDVNIVLSGDTNNINQGEISFDVYVDGLKPSLIASAK